MDFTSWDACLRPNELMHHGIKGMEWGQRRYQNEDGSLTAAGRQRYGVGEYEPQKHFSWGKHDYQSTRSKRLNRQIHRVNKKGAKLAKKLSDQYGSDTDKITKDKRAIRYDEKARKLNEKMNKSIESDFRKQSIRANRKKQSLAKKAVIAVAANKLGKRGYGTKGQKMVKSLLLYKAGKRIFR